MSRKKTESDREAQDVGASHAPELIEGIFKSLEEYDPHNTYDHVHAAIYMVLTAAALIGTEIMRAPDSDEESDIADIANLFNALLETFANYTGGNTLPSDEETESN